jgi:predicted DNA-binding transcriptional regulator AlpA
MPHRTGATIENEAETQMARGTVGEADMRTTGTEAGVLWKAADVARALAVDTRTIWRWASAGVIPAPLRIGGSTRWRRSDIEALIEAKAGEAAREAARYAKQD